MRLIIREYLAPMRESGELDALLPDLLLSMGVVPTSKPKVGARQYGVDIAGVGKDPEDNQRKVFLLTVKAGDVTRSVWDGSEQAIRSSLNEILEVYIPTHIPGEYADLPIKIVLCFNGELKQPVQQNWVGYTKKNRVEGEIEFEHWGGDDIAALVEEYVLDEFLFPSAAQSQIRRTLVLLGDRDYDLSHYYNLVEETLFGKDLATEKERLKALRLINLCGRIIFQWAREEDNLKPALQAAERTVLNVWGWMYEEDIFEEKKVLSEFLKIYDTWLDVAHAYHSKVRPAYQIEDGLFGFSAAEEIEYPLRVYEQIGICSLIGLNEWYLATLSNLSGNEESASEHLQNALAITNDFAGLISNNGPAFNPPYDEHINEIELGLLLFVLLDRRGDAIRWIAEIANQIEFAFMRLGRRFPVYISSYETLVELEVGETEPEMPSSTLLTALAEWAVVLQRADLYQHIREIIDRTFSDTDLQVWYPDEETEEKLYRQNASRTGTMHTSISLPDGFEAFKEFIVQERKKEEGAPLYSAVEQSLMPLELLASRHFRTPLHPRIRRDLMGLSQEEEE